MLLSPDKPAGGTGFHIQAPSGKFYIMTNKHVCSLAREKREAVGLDQKGNIRFKSNFIIEVVDGHKTALRKVVKVGGPKVDLCLVEPLYQSGLTRIAKSRSILPVITTGHGGLGPITSTVGFKRDDHLGIVCVKPSFMGCMEITRYETDAYSMLIIGGHSGSPIINPFGALVGVIFAGGSRSGFDLALAMPIKYVRDILKGM